MARRVIHFIEITDDLDKASPAEETIELGLDGSTYVLDLTAENAQVLRDLIQPYLEAAHERWKTPPRKNKKKPGRKPVEPELLALPAPKDRSRGKSQTPEDAADYRQRVVDRDARRVMRKWAHRHGHAVSATGQIAAPVVLAYRDANPGAYIPESTLQYALAHQPEEEESFA